MYRKFAVRKSHSLLRNFGRPGTALPSSFLLRTLGLDVVPGSERRLGHPAKGGNDGSHIKAPTTDASDLGVGVALLRLVAEPAACHALLPPQKPDFRPNNHPRGLESRALRFEIGVEAHVVLRLLQYGVHVPLFTGVL